jgi:hypothetical protein
MAMDQVRMQTTQVDADFILRVLADEHRQQATPQFGWRRDAHSEPDRNY